MPAPGKASISDEERAALGTALSAYELVGVLGRGAFAVVYAARHVRLDREVAIKRLASEHLRDRDARDRFAVEARLLASLDHPHVVRVHDYVEDEDVCALVMERTHGGTLADRMRVGRLGAASSCAIAIAALHGLEHAHRRGVLHRDVKPENLLFADSDLVKVADFGIAKVLGARGSRLTATAGTLGTPAYMAPEQVRRAAGPLGPATDVWAVGAVLYELLAGRPPFPHDDRTELTELLLARVSAAPRELTDAAPGVPPAIAGVVMHALRPDPRERPQSAAGFADALTLAAERDLGPGCLGATRIPIHRSEPARDGGPTLAGPAGREPAAGRHRPALPGGRGVALAGGLALAALAVIVVVLGAGGGGRGGPLANLPARPAGWPARMALGYVDLVSGPAGVRRRMGAGAIAYENYGTGDPLAGKDWSHDRLLPSPRRFAADAQRHGLMPYLTYYELRSLGRDGQDDANAPQIRRILVNRRLMRVYWRNVRAFLTELGQTRKPVAVTFEPGMWALLEQAIGFTGDQPSSVPAVVAGAGMRDLRGLEDNLPGFSDAWRRLRDRYAPNVRLGVTLDFYGTNIDLHRELPSHATVLAAAAQQGRFLLNLFATALDFDFVSFELAFTEAGSSTTDRGYTDAQKAAVVAWVRQFERVVRLPLFVESVPEGNTIMKTIDDRPYHYHDTWVQWLLGDARFTHLRALRDAGVIGVQFGVTPATAGTPAAPPPGSTGTCGCDAAHDGVTNAGRRGAVSRSVDDDGGYLAARVAALRRAGGLALAAPIAP